MTQPIDQDPWAWNHFEPEPGDEWNCLDCGGSGDSGRTSRDEHNQRVGCGTCMGRGTVHYDPRPRPGSGLKGCGE